MRNPSKNKILNIDFNQDLSCFACGTELGIRVYNTDPFKGGCQRFLDGGIEKAVMFYRSNILALVGGGKKPKYPNKKVMIWDDEQKKCIGEISFKKTVRTVKVHTEYIVVVLEQGIYIYQFNDLKLLEVIDTYNNFNGLCAISESTPMIIACPYKSAGYLRIINYGTKSPIEIKAHDSAIANISMSMNGVLCATSSDEGKVIRVLDCSRGTILQELRRGTDKAIINCITFSHNGEWIVCSSDKETVHIFSTAKAIEVASPSNKAADRKDAAKNPESVFTFMKDFVSYFKPERSFAQFRLSHQKSVVGFGAPGTCQVIILTYAGMFYKIQFDPKTGGECTKIEEKSLYTDK